MLRFQFRTLSIPLLVFAAFTLSLMPDSIDIELAGVHFQLFADCGLFWPAQSMLFIADTHFGKEATFRRSGIPVPVGATDATIAKISRMLHRTNAARLCILGDMFHARSSIDAIVFDSLQLFFAKFLSLEISLIRGNHDARVGPLPDEWPIEVFDAGKMIDRVALGHHPAVLPAGADIYLCGHIHPAVKGLSRKEAQGRIPCFWHSRGQLVLPAIGAFTGTHVITLSAGDIAWITAENQILRYF